MNNLWNCFGIKSFPPRVLHAERVTKGERERERERERRNHNGVKQFLCKAPSPARQALRGNYYTSRAERATWNSRKCASSAEEEDSRRAKIELNELILYATSEEYEFYYTS